MRFHILWWAFVTITSCCGIRLIINSSWCWVGHVGGVRVGGGVDMKTSSCTAASTVPLQTNVSVRLPHLITLNLTSECCSGQTILSRVFWDECVWNVTLLINSSTWMFSVLRSGFCSWVLKRDVHLHPVVAESLKEQSHIFPHSQEAASQRPGSFLCVNNWLEELKLALLISHCSFSDSSRDAQCFKSPEKLYDRSYTRGANRKWVRSHRLIMWCWSESTWFYSIGFYAEVNYSCMFQIKLG